MGLEGEGEEGGLGGGGGIERDARMCPLGLRDEHVRPGFWRRGLARLRKLASSAPIALPRSEPTALSHPRTLPESRHDLAEDKLPTIPKPSKKPL